jgi:Cu+-exporting ATPase
MIGDGLNDAGALRQSDVGISISEDINTFTPAADAILDSDQFKNLPTFLKFSRISIRIIMISFLISFLYNFIGLYFAIQGTLSPLIAAILMPISSLTVVLFTMGATALFGKKLGLRI